MKSAHRICDQVSSASLVAFWTALALLVVTQPTNAKDKDASKLASTVCAGCHGADGNSLVPAFPSLAGQPADYLVKQLEDFLSGKRKNDAMAAVLTQLKKMDLYAVATYYSSQKTVGTKADTMTASVDTSANKGDMTAKGETTASTVDTTGANADNVVGAMRNTMIADMGRKLFMKGDEENGVAACSGCHMENGAGNTRYPRLAGQQSAYLVQQLLNFKNETRINDRARVMRIVAGGLSEQEIKAVAEYVSGM